jgi:hypothetical protein
LGKTIPFALSLANQHISSSSLLTVAPSICASICKEEFFFTEQGILRNAADGRLFKDRQYTRQPEDPSVGIFQQKNIVDSRNADARTRSGRLAEITSLPQDATQSPVVDADRQDSNAFRFE